MDYGALGFDAAPTSGTTQSDPNALHGVQITSVRVAGKPLYQDGNVVLTGSDEPTFAVRVSNGGEVPETGVDVEVILNTAAERQSESETISRLERQEGDHGRDRRLYTRRARRDREGHRQGGPVEYEKSTSNNTLTGTVKFGI